MGVLSITQQKPCPKCKVLIDVSNYLCDNCKDKEKIKKRNYDKNRETSTKRGYDRRWRKARRAFLVKNPLCIECLEGGQVKEAIIVDHIIPHRGDKSLFWDKNNWQVLCKRCHDRKTAKGL